MAFKDNLKLRMKELNLTAADIMRTSMENETDTSKQISRSDISYYLSGKRIPKYEKLSTLAKILNMPVEWLIQEHNDSLEQSKTGNVINNINNKNCTINNSIKNKLYRLSDEEKEVIRIFRKLTVRQRHNLLSILFEYEEAVDNNATQPNLF